MPEQRRELARFGVLVGSVFGAFGAWFVWRSGGASVTGKTLIGVGATLFLLGGVAPLTLRRFYAIWMFIGHIVGRVNTTIVLSLIYYIGFSLARLYLLVTRTDPMARRPAGGQGTYWIDVADKVPDQESYRHIF